MQSEKTFTITHIPNSMVVPEGLHPFTIRDYARLPGFPDYFIFENKRSAYRLIGNAGPVQIWEWVGKESVGISTKGKTTNDYRHTSRPIYLQGILLRLLLSQF